jgi:hypothetical protein
MAHNELGLTNARAEFMGSCHRRHLSPRRGHIIVGIVWSLMYMAGIRCARDGLARNDSDKPMVILTGDLNVFPRERIGCADARTNKHGIDTARVKPPWFARWLTALVLGPEISCERC